MNKQQKKIIRLAKETQADVKVSFRRARKVARDCYRIIDEIKRLDAKKEQELRAFYGN